MTPDIDYVGILSIEFLLDGEQWNPEAWLRQRIRLNPSPTRYSRNRSSSATVRQCGAGRSVYEPMVTNNPGASSGPAAALMEPAWILVQCS